MPLSSRCWAMNSKSAAFLSVGFKTRKNRFSRLKPVTAISGSWSFKWHRMSSRTARGGRGRECSQHRTGGQHLYKRGDVHIGRAEIMAPLRDAMGLVHRHQRDGHRRGKALEFSGHQPLGGHIDDFVHSLPGVVQSPYILLIAQRRIEICPGNPRRLQRPHLILHE